MRPSYLSIEGLACFKDKQELDLRTLELFAIWGPTGAGKSTVLDAIIFALYGEVPRVSNADRAEMISAGCPRASVMLEFGVGTQRYRIARSLPRSGHQTVRFEQHDGTDFNIRVADQVRSAAEKVVEVVGLEAAAFKQAVVLPQGEFAQFLKAEPRARRNMLISLLGLRVYEQMRNLAQYQATIKQTAVTSAEKRLNEDYGDLTDDSLVTLEGRRGVLAAELEGLRKKRDQEQQQLELTRAHHSKTAELAGLQSQQAQLGRSTAEIAGLRDQIVAAKRAAPLVFVVEQTLTLILEGKSAREAAAKAQLEQREAEAEWGRKAAAQRECEKAAEATPELHQKIQQLNQVIGRLPAVAEHEAAVVCQTEEIDQLVKDLVALKAQVEAAQAAKKTEQARIEAAEKASRASGYDAELDRLLQALQPRAIELDLARGTLAEARRELHTRKEALRIGEATLVIAEREALEAGNAAEASRQKAQSAEEALHRAHRLEAANQLRNGLKPGEPCPVCEQAVSAPVAPSKSPKVDAARSVLEAAKLHVTEAEKKARKTTERVATGQAYVATARTAVQQGEEQTTTVEAKVTKPEAELRAALGPRLGTAGGPVETWIKARIESVAAERTAHALARTQLEKAERALEKALSDEVAHRERASEKESLRKRRDEERAQSRQRLAAARAEIAAVTTSADPKKEADALAKQIEKLTLAAKEATTAGAGAEKRLATAVEAVRLTSAASERAQEAAGRQVKHRDQEVTRAGFSDEAAVRAAILASPALTLLESRVQKHEQDCHSVEARVATLTHDLGEVRISDEQLATAAKSAKDLDIEVETQHGVLKALEGQVASVKQRIERWKAVKEQLALDHGSLRVYDQLASDLKNDKFQAFLVEEAFTELVRGASTRLLALTDQRYSLFFKDDEIRVVDRDNANETRLCDTLSGGETFLTSLALALELSVQVQRAAGAVNLDSLFIDEGFGTLDPETVMIVSDTLLKLQEHGRMVGIITHLPDLRDQFKQKVVVTKHQGYSTVAIAAGPEKAA